MERSFKQYIHSIESSDVIGRAQYINNGNGPLLPIFYELETNKYIQKILKNIIYSIIGAGMRLYNKTSDRGVSCLLSSFFPLYPRKAISVVLSIANLNLILTCLTTSQYLSFLFLAMRSANLLVNCLHSFVLSLF